MVVAGEAAVRRLGLTPLAGIEAYGMSADRFPSLHTVPALAMDKARTKIGVDAADLGVLEVNEAFAGVAVHTDAHARTSTRRS